LGFSQYLIDQAQAVFDVIAAGELGHHTAVGGVQGDLRMQGFGHHLAGLQIKQCHAGFVAGRLDAEHPTSFA
jgi:putative NIF3 family GTP cyclohydrolase 1 type 2